MNRDPRATPHPVGPSGPQAPPRLPRGGPVPTNGDSRCVISRRTVGWPERDSLPFACSESLGAKIFDSARVCLPCAPSAVGDWGALRADDGWRWPAATEARRDAAARACQCGPHAAGLISGGSLRMTVHGRVCVDSATQPRGGGAMQRRDMRGLGHSWPCHCQCQCQASRIDLGGSRADETRRGEVPLPEPSMAAVTGQTGGLHLPQSR